MEIKHIVMWRVSGASTEERHANSVVVCQAFESLRGLIPGLLDMEMGIDTSDVDYACNVVMSTRFRDSQSLKAYASHPEHLRVRQALGTLRTARFQVDYPVKPDR